MHGSTLIQKLIHNTLRNPAGFFLVTAALFGVIICFRLPPLTGTDEFTHFPRVYQITEGVLWQQKLPDLQYGGKIPSHVNEMINDYRDLTQKRTLQEYTTRTRQLNARYSSQNRVGTPVDAVYTSVATYPPWAYLPSVLGLMTAKLLHTPLLWYVYFARLSTLLVWLILSWCAIRLLPGGKWFMTVIALLPTSLSQATTVGGDGLLTGLSWLMIAFVLAVMAHKIKLTWTWLTIFGAVSLYLAIIKVGYWLLSLLPLVIPAYYFANRRLAVIWKLVVALLVMVGSILFARHNVEIANYTVLTPRTGVYINSHQQELYVIHYPLLFLVRAVGQFFTNSYDSIYMGMVGVLTNRLIYLPLVAIGMLYLALFVSFTSSAPLPSLQKHRWLLVATFLAAFVGTCLFISLAFYIGNTEVGSDTIFGIYGRYYLPILPLLLAIPLTMRGSDFTKTYHPLLPIVSIIGLLYASIFISH